MAANGVNAVRTYTIPPRWLLDLAAEHGLRVMVGLPWEQHVAFLDEPGARRVDRASACARACARARATPRCSATRSATRSPPRSCAGTAASGSSASSSGSTEAAKDEDPERARHLRQLPEHRVPRSCRSSTSSASTSSSRPAARSRPTSRGSRTSPATGRWSSPRSASTAGATARRPRRARSTGRCARAFAAGCAGDVRLLLDRRVAPRRLRHRRLGLRPRRPRPRSRSRRSRRSAAPSPTRPSRREPDWPRISVVVCTYNGERTLPECLDAPARARLPRLRGDRRRRRLHRRARPRSRCEHGFRLISTENRASRCARNAGLEAATGRDRRLHRRRRLPGPALALAPGALRSCEPTTPASAAPTSRRPATATIAECVANAPGGPIHVLLSDEIAEHIPGCNMAFREARASRRSAASTRSSGSRATTSTSAGACRTAAGRSASAPARSSGTTAAARSRTTSSSSSSTARPRRCSSASGPSATTAPATSPGPAASTPTSLHAQPRAAALEDLLRHLGHGPVPVRLRAARRASSARCR